MDLRSTWGVQLVGLGGRELSTTPGSRLGVTVAVLPGSGRSAPAPAEQRGRAVTSARSRGGQTSLLREMSG